MPMLGPTRVNGAFYSFLAECEALTGEKWRQFAGENQVSGGGLAVIVMEHPRGPGEKRCLAPDFCILVPIRAIRG